MWGVKRGNSLPLPPLAAPRPPRAATTVGLNHSAPPLTGPRPPVTIRLIGTLCQRHTLLHRPVATYLLSLYHSLPYSTALVLSSHIFQSATPHFPLYTTCHHTIWYQLRTFLYRSVPIYILRINHSLLYSTALIFYHIEQWPPTSCPSTTHCPTPLSSYHRAVATYLLSPYHSLPLHCLLYFHMCVIKHI